MPDKKETPSPPVVRNKRGDPEPKWFFGFWGTVLSIIFFPVFIIASYIYVSRWMCYNLDLPNAICYILALIGGPLYTGLFLISFLVRGKIH